MQASVQYLEKQSLPDGWKEHFDSQRNIWYYVDLSSEPPRISLVHPSELKDKRSPGAISLKLNKDHLRLSPTQRPAGPRDSAPTSSSGITHPSQRPRRATVAQQLYASSLSLGTKEPSGGTTISESSSRTSSHRPSASSTPVSQGINLPLSTASSGSSAGSSSCVSPASPITPSPNIDLHNPRNFLDYTRLAGTRRVTYSGPQPSIGPRSTGKSKLPPINIVAPNEETGGLGADAFYPPSVKTTPSPMPLRSASDPNTHPSSALSALDNYQMKDMGKVGATNPTTVPSPSPLIKATNLTPHLSIPTGPDATSLTWNPQEDNLSSSRLLPLPLEVPKEETGTASVRPLPPTTKQAKVNPPPQQQTILQPKPVRPLAGVSLNLQVQVAGVESEASPNQLADTSILNSKKKKKPLLKSFNIGISKNAKGKTPIRTIYDRQMLSSSPVADELYN